MDERERVYCATMMLQELDKLLKPAGDTRAYLSLDDNDTIVAREALRAYLVEQAKLAGVRPAVTEENN